MDYILFLCSEVYTETPFRLRHSWDEGKEKEENKNNNKTPWNYLLAQMTLQLKNSSFGMCGETVTASHFSLLLFLLSPTWWLKNSTLKCGSKNGLESPIRIEAHTREGAHSKEQRICHSLDSLRGHVLFNSMFIIISLKACHKGGELEEERVSNWDPLRVQSCSLSESLKYKNKQKGCGSCPYYVSTADFFPRRIFDQ